MLGHLHSCDSVSDERLRTLCPPVHMFDGLNFQMIIFLFLKIYFDK